MPPAGAAKFLDRQPWVATVEKDSVDMPGDFARIVDRSVADNMNDLDELYARQRLAELVVLAAGKLVHDLDSCCPSASVMVDYPLGGLFASQKKCRDRRRDCSCDPAYLIIRDRPRPAGHLSYEPDRRGPKRDRISSLLLVRDAADLYSRCHFRRISSNTSPNS